LFKGNLRGQAAKSYEKSTNRMHVFICFSFVPFLAVSSLIRHAIQLNRINLGISISFSSKLIQRMISQWQLWFLEDLAARNNR
jgi:hypothetical protein